MVKSAYRFFPPSGAVIPGKMHGMCVSVGGGRASVAPVTALLVCTLLLLLCTLCRSFYECMGHLMVT